jgi:ATP-dependent exoDNAse (exonuclease V) beta subunit
LQLRVFGDAGETRENLGAVLMRLGREHAAAFDPADFAGLIAFRDRLREWRVRRDYVTFDRILLAAIDDCGYPPAPNIDKFLAQARAAAARMPLAEFVEELALVRADNPREADSPPEDSANTVKVMTVHSAKGLEFPIVFLAAMQKGIQTNLAAVEFSRRFGLGVTWRDPANGKEVADLFQNAIGEERERSEKEEGHRLLYVAMTRAEHHLAMSFSGRRQNWASVLVDSLDIDYKTPADQRVTRAAPDGVEWTLRLHIADAAPEPVASAATASRASRPVPVPQLLPAPVVTGQHDTAANVTALAAFASCPRKYYLGWYLGFDRPGPVPSAAPAAASALRADELGSQVHALLAGAAVPNADPEAARLAAVFRTSDLGRRAARASRTEREFDFVMSFEDLVVRGQVDLWFEEGGELVIVDYKTDAVSALEALQRAGEYALQLRLYATAVERIAGRPPDRAFLHFLRPGRIVEVDLSPSLLDSPEQIARDFQDAQESLQFPLNEAPHCRSCAFYKDLCPAGNAGGSDGST